MATEVLDREELISAIWSNRGKVALAAQSLGVTTATVYNYVNKYATVKNALEGARQHSDELLLDTAEFKLYQAVAGAEAWAVKYALSTKGKGRGYVERTEHTGADGDAIAIKGYAVVSPDDWDDASD